MDVCGAHAPHTSIFPQVQVISLRGIPRTRLKVEDAECIYRRERSEDGERISRQEE